MISKRRFRLFHVNLIYTLLVFVIPTFALDAIKLSEEKIEIRGGAGVDLTKITVGDKIEYVLSLDEESLDVKQVVSIEPQDLKPYRLLENHFENTKLVLSFAPYKAGTEKIKELTVSLSNGKVFIVPAHEFKIESVLKDSDKNKTEEFIFSPEKIGLSFWVIFLFGLIILLILIGLVKFFEKISKKNKNIESVINKPDEEILTAYELFVKTVKQILAKKYLEQGSHKYYYYELSDALKKFISENFDFDALEMTTREIITHLNQKLSSIELNEIEEILNEIDVYKFTKVTPTLEASEQLLKRVQQFANKNSLQKKVVASHAP